MPRGTINKSSLGYIRQAAGFSQPAFAELVSCSVDTIRSIEAGRLNLSPKLAIQIRMKTGCRISLDPKGIPIVKTLDWRDQEYSNESYELWKTWLKEIPPQSQDRRKKIIRKVLLDVLEASSKTGCFLPIFHSLMGSIVGTATDYGLQEELIRKDSSRKSKKSGLDSCPDIDLFTQIEKLLDPTDDEIKAMGRDSSTSTSDEIKKKEPDSSEFTPDEIKKRKAGYKAFKKELKEDQNSARPK